MKVASFAEWQRRRQEGRKNMFMQMIRDLPVTDSKHKKHSDTWFSDVSMTTFLLCFFVPLISTFVWSNFCCNSISWRFERERHSMCPHRQWINNGSLLQWHLDRTKSGAPSPSSSSFLPPPADGSLATIPRSLPRGALCHFSRLSFFFPLSLL